MKITKCLALFLMLLTGNVYSKNLPPGTAESVLANTLILLDRTFSMLQPAEEKSIINAPSGKAALSKIVVFGLDLYANIAGEANLVGDSESDIVTINSAASDSASIRLNWRENF
jgi:hypothetical protein|tara:strand:- start:530 stop:871 length:342 start_codon:yes stop_codon:yes gene_type:complete